MYRIRTLLFVATIAFMLCFSNNVALADNISVVVNGSSVVFPDAQPFINKDQRTMVPIRFVSESLKYDVKWDGVENIVTLNKGGVDGTKIELKIGRKTLKVNGYDIQIDTEPIIIQDRTMVPLRFISETFGGEVIWDAENLRVTINTNKPVDNPVSNNTVIETSATIEGNYIITPITEINSKFGIATFKGPTTAKYYNLFISGLPFGIDDNDKQVNVPINGGAIIAFPVAISDTSLLELRFYSNESSTTPIGKATLSNGTFKM